MNAVVSPLHGGRVAVERVLREAKSPLGAKSIAMLTALPIVQVRNHLANAVNKSRARNVGLKRYGLYLWGPLPAVAVPESVARSTGNYTGEKPTYIAPERMRAFELPSLVNGQRTERVRPACIGGAAK